ncbi:hypothetical protein OsccyDRAFT_4259 [Leptolyngbyaceae cyanobacterium JSC-12]|nr:hypothetical protein OsccyDRAFT_4259 [Leptolyngbyaceae cyanobacterium JSC-12]
MHGFSVNIFYLFLLPSYKCEARSQKIYGIDESGIDFTSILRNLNILKLTPAS